MALSIELFEVPKPVVTAWLRELRNPKYPVLPEGHYVSIQKTAYIDGELTELYLYNSSEGCVYLTTDPNK